MMLKIGVAIKKQKVFTAQTETIKNLKCIDKCVLIYLSPACKKNRFIRK